MLRTIDSSWIAALIAWKVQSLHVFFHLPGTLIQGLFRSLFSHCATVQSETFFIQTICTKFLLELNIRALKLSLCYTLVYGSIDAVDQNAQLIWWSQLKIFIAFANNLNPSKVAHKLSMSPKNVQCRMSPNNQHWHNVFETKYLGVCSWKARWWRN